MKKAFYLLLLLASAQTLMAQGFLNKIKSKINSNIEKQAQAAQQQQATTQNQGSSSYTNPSQYGTLILTYSKPEIEKHMGGESGGAFDLWFQNVSVVNNQLKFQMVDYDQVYDYTGGKVVKTGATTTQHENNQRNGSEADFLSKDFTQLDVQNTMLKKGTHISTGMFPGKPSQTLVFNGKEIGSFYMYSISHNYDSTAVAVAGASLGNGGLKASLITSKGQTIPLPNATGAQSFISPDGNIAAAIIMVNIKPGEPNVYLTNGTKTFFKDGGAMDKVWLRNSGSLFYVGGDQKTLYRNGEVYHAFDDHYQDDPKTIFIGKDDKNMCWAGDHALCFSDGTKFENASSPHKVTIDNKDAVIFFAVNVTSGEVYLCRHDL